MHNDPRAQEELEKHAEERKQMRELRDKERERVRKEKADKEASLKKEEEERQKGGRRTCGNAAVMWYVASCGGVLRDCWHMVGSRAADESKRAARR